MALSPAAQLAFNEWIGKETWHTGHLLDQKRFFRFVWAVLEDPKRRPSKTALRDSILREWKGRFDKSALEELARKYAALYTTLCDFAGARRSHG